MFPSLWAFRWHRSSWRENSTRKKRLEWEETLLIPKSNKWNPKKRQVNKKAKKERKKETNKQPMQKIVFNWLLKKNDRGCFFWQSWPKVLKFLNLNDVCWGFWGANSLKAATTIVGGIPNRPGNMVPAVVPHLYLPAVASKASVAAWLFCRCRCKRIPFVGGRETKKKTPSREVGFVEIWKVNLILCFESLKCMLWS